MRICLWAVVVLFLACPRTSLAQVPAANSAAAGTGKIAGQITARGSGKPLRGATVRLIRWEGGRGMPSAGSSGTDGRFEFAGLRAGEYQVTVTAERYVGLDFGQRVPTEPGQRINLADGQVFDAANVALPPTSGIEGRLVDEFGEPVPGVTLQVSRVQFVAGKRRLLPVPNSIAPRPTDDLGQFRLFNLPPGDYYLLALSGPFAGADDPSGFAPTYYPGTPNAPDAQAVHLDVGQDASNVTFALQPAPMATIAGVITDAGGQPLTAGDVMLFQLHGGDVRAIVSARGPTDRMGAFSFRNVAPGTYVVQAFGRPVGGGSLGSAPFGATPVTVTAGDVRDVKVSVKGVFARGRVVFDGDAPLPAPTAFRVSPQPVDFVTGPVGGGPSPSTTRDDWTFEVTNLSGRRAIRVLTGSAAWTLKRVMLGGRDVTDQAVDFRGADVEGLEITLSSRFASVGGTVTDRNQPATSYAVVAFAQDRTKWEFPSRFIAVGSPNQQGVFRVPGLPPDDYLVAAIPAGEVQETQDPEYLDKLRPYATSVRLADNEVRTVTLTLVRR